ncbi:MAG: DUF559 domain-containing protein [Rhodococcus sp. (in: high G+C Gram-positive bacteria)]
MGVYTREQLLDSGIGRSRIDRRVRSGTLVRLLPCVYADRDPSYYELCVAVTVWRGDAVLSHLSAAWLWGMLDTTPSQVHATLPRNTRVSGPDWLTLHRRSVDTTEARGLPVVPAAQCFVDAAATMSGTPLEQIVDRSVGTVVSWREAVDHCERSAGMTGVREVRRQLRQCCPGTLSEPERMVARALTARGIRMEINAWVGRYLCDLVDNCARVIVEIDGREFHSDSRTFDNDRTRQNSLVLDDWLVLRFSAATVYRDIERVADQIAAVVRRRRKSRGV